MSWRAGLVSVLVIAGCTHGHGPTVASVVANDLQVSTLKNTPVSGSVQASSPDPITFSLTTPPALGTVSLDAETGAFTYQPYPNVVGNDSFQYVAADGRRGNGVGTVQVSIALLSAASGNLRLVLTGILGVEDSGSLAPGCSSLAYCPVSNPIAYLEANTAAIDGTGVGSAQTPGPMSAAGYAAWVTASSSACGIMANAVGGPVLFPAGVHDYTELYSKLLNRAPVQEEIDALEAVEATFADDPGRAAAACSTVLATTEFIATH